MQYEENESSSLQGKRRWLVLAVTVELVELRNIARQKIFPGNSARVGRVLQTFVSQKVVVGWTITRHPPKPSTCSKRFWSISKLKREYWAVSAQICQHYGNFSNDLWLIFVSPNQEGSGNYSSVTGKKTIFSSLAMDRMDNFHLRSGSNLNANKCSRQEVWLR